MKQDMNQYLQNLKKIEFVITYACTGRCRHCSEGDHASCGEHIDPVVAASAVREIAGKYAIKTLMTFGGEPLLYPDAVCAIHEAGKAVGIPRRQLITNGYFSKDRARIQAVVKRLAASGINDVLLSVDAFHQETIPLERVMDFALAVQKAGMPLRTQPAWLVSVDDDNQYNLTTKEILAQFDALGIMQNDGNVIFPSGNALKYLKEYFDPHNTIVNPYEENPRRVETVSFEPDGGVLGGNVYRQSITEILDTYSPHAFRE